MKKRDLARLDDDFEAWVAAQFSPKLVLAMTAEIRAARSMRDNLCGCDEPYGGWAKEPTNEALNYDKAREHTDKLLEEMG